MLPLASHRRDLWLPAAYLACVLASVAFAFLGDAQVGGTWLFLVTLPWSAVANTTWTLAAGMHPYLGPWAAVSTMLAGACVNAALLHWALRPRRVALRH